MSGNTPIRHLHAIEKFDNRVIGGEPVKLKVRLHRFSKFSRKMITDMDTNEISSI